MVKISAGNQKCIILKFIAGNTIFASISFVPEISLENLPCILEDEDYGFRRPMLTPSVTFGCNGGTLKNTHMLIPEEGYLC